MTPEISGRLYTDGKPVSIRVVEGYIEAVAPLHEPLAAKHDLYLAPGLIDIQVNGFHGVDFSGEDLTVAGVRQVTSALWQEGVTTYLPTLISAPIERLHRNLTILAEARQDPEIACSVPGFHLEGPYLSHEDGARGAHDRLWVHEPDWQEFSELNEAAGDGILLVTLAPELAGGIEFISRAAETGVLIALGHHNATASVIKQAVDAGAVLSTHLGNACTNLIHRHDNPLWPQLAEDRMMASIIVDGFHLREEEVKVFLRAKGAERIVLVSDVTMLAGMPPGAYQWHGEELVLREDGMIRYPAQNVLAGASLPLSRTLVNMMRFTGCSLSEAIAMATSNPARLFGWSDLGSIEPGKRADLVVFKYENGEIAVRQTMVAGQVVFEQ